MVMPWDFKVAYGIIGDTIKIPFFFKDSPKRGYIVICSLIQATLLFWSAFYIFEDA